MKGGGVGIFAVWPFFRSVFRFCCPLRFPVFRFLASGFGFLAKIEAVFRLLVTDVPFFFGFSNLEGSQRQTSTGS